MDNSNQTSSSSSSNPEDSRQDEVHTSQSSKPVSDLETNNQADITDNDIVPPNGNVNNEGADGKKEAREHTRSKVAYLFVLGFFAILFLCVAYAVKVNASLVQLKDILVAVIGALSSTLGFIVGYYYKSVQES